MAQKLSGLQVLVCKHRILEFRNLCLKVKIQVNIICGTLKMGWYLKESVLSFFNCSVPFVWLSWKFMFASIWQSPKIQLVLKDIKKVKLLIPLFIMSFVNIFIKIQHVIKNNPNIKIVFQLNNLK